MLRVFWTASKTFHKERVPLDSQQWFKLWESAVVLNIENEKFTVVCSPCRQNLKFGNFNFSFDRLYQIILLNCVPQVQQDYFFPISPIIVFWRCLRRCRLLRLNCLKNTVKQAWTLFFFFQFLTSPRRKRFTNLKIYISKFAEKRVSDSLRGMRFAIQAWIPHRILTLLIY